MAGRFFVSCCFLVFLLFAASVAGSLEQDQHDPQPDAKEQV